MNVKEVVTEEQLHEVLPVLQQLRMKLSKEETSSLFRNMKKKIINYFRRVMRMMKLLALQV